MGIIDTKKSILNPTIKKLKVDQNELVAIGFCATLGNILYGVIRRVSTALSWYSFPSPNELFIFGIPMLSRSKSFPRFSKQLYF